MQNFANDAKMPEADQGTEYAAESQAPQRREEDFDYLVGENNNNQNLHHVPYRGLAQKSISNPIRHIAHESASTNTNESRAQI